MYGIKWEFSKKKYTVLVDKLLSRMIILNIYSFNAVVIGNMSSDYNTVYSCFYEHKDSIMFIYTKMKAVANRSGAYIGKMNKVS